MTAASVESNLRTCLTQSVNNLFSIIKICYLNLGVLKNFAIFTGKHVCWSHFLIKLQAWRPANLLKKDSNRSAFFWISRNFSEKLFSSDLPKTVRKLCLSTKFPHQEIRVNYGGITVFFAVRVGYSGSSYLCICYCSKLRHRQSLFN